MAKPLYTALLFLIVLARVAPAQTAATTGGVAGTTLANPYGAVRLPAATAAPSTVSTGSSSAAAGVSPGIGSGGAAIPARPVSSAAPSSGHSGSGGSSAFGAATSSKGVPSWVLCPPPGATGIAPFVTGTELSCAP